MKYIEFDKVTKTYAKGDSPIHAVRDISLEISKEEFVAITGPSGSGKSTMLHLLGCVDLPSSGDITVCGQAVEDLNDRQLTKLRLHKIGFVFQRFYLIPTLNAQENVELPMKEAGLSRADRESKSLALLKKVELEPRATHYPSQMSGGEMQRVAIARALANGAELILADEPTGELDSNNGKMVLDLLLQLNKEGMTVVVATHEDFITKRAKKIIQLKDGQTKS